MVRLGTTEKRLLPTQTDLTCRCGKVHIRFAGEPLLCVECQCSSCRKAATLLAQPVTSTTGGVPYVMYRKDRVSFTAGAELLRSYRLTTESHTRRVVAGCCETPLFVEFQGGHWLSVYASLWPADTRPAPTMRTMVSDLPAGHELPSDIPNHRTQSARFFFALLLAWAAMGFRTPKIAVASETVWPQAA
jgi:hypothetical protein